VPNRESGAFDQYTGNDRLSIPNLNGGAVAWTYKHIGGIQADEENPGFKNVLVKPQIGGGLSCASTHYDSIHGRIETHWYIEEGDLGDPNQLHLEVTVPTNTTAKVYIPGLDPSVIFEGETGTTLAYLAEGVTLTEEIEETNTFVYDVVSGIYHFLLRSVIPFFSPSFPSSLRHSREGGNPGLTAHRYPVPNRSRE
jgi:hypothetical protein